MRVLLVVQRSMQHLFQKIPSHSKTGNHSTYHKNAATSEIRCGSSSTAEKLGTRRGAEAVQGMSGTDPGRDSSRLSGLIVPTPTGCSAGPDLGAGVCISGKEGVNVVHRPFTSPSSWTDLTPPWAGQGDLQPHTPTGTGCPSISWWNNTLIVGKSIERELERKSIDVFAWEFLLQ